MRMCAFTLSIWGVLSRGEYDFNDLETIQEKADPGLSEQILEWPIN